MALPHAPMARRDFLLLHLMILAWGMTAVLGKGITLPSSTLVAWRTGLAALGLLVWLRWQRRPLWPGLRVAVQLSAVGLIIGFHWFLFFLAGKLGPISVALIGVATYSLWCALLEPLFIKGKQFHLVEMGLAGVMVLGATVIGLGDPISWPCLLTGVAAAVVSAVFSFLNNHLVKGHDAMVMTMYEMLSACVFMSCLTLLQPAQRWVPESWEWAWLLLLSQVCTVWAFSMNIKLMQRISVYTIGLTSNLEPIWGVLLAAAILGEADHLKWTFWLGSGLVLLSVLLHMLAQRAAAKRISSS